jgi:hypothetical protein
VRPEEIIRRYLDDQGTPIDARVGHLLVSFGFERLTQEALVTIDGALARAGVRPDPRLSEFGAVIRPDSPLTLSLANVPDEAEVAGPLAAEETDNETEERPVGEADQPAREPAPGGATEQPVAPDGARKPVETQKPKAPVDADAETDRGFSAGASEIERVRAEAREFASVARNRLSAATKLQEELEREQERRSSLAAQIKVLTESRMTLRNGLERVRAAAQVAAERHQVELDAARRQVEKAEKELERTRAELVRVRRQSAEEVTTARARLSEATEEAERERGARSSLVERLESLTRSHSPPREQLEREGDEHAAPTGHTGGLMESEDELREEPDAPKGRMAKRFKAQLARERERRGAFVKRMEDLR